MTDRSSGRTSNGNTRPWSFFVRPTSSLTVPAIWGGFGRFLRFTALLQCNGAPIRTNPDVLSVFDRPAVTRWIQLAVDVDHRAASDSPPQVGLGPYVFDCMQRCADSRLFRKAWK